MADMRQLTSLTPKTSEVQLSRNGKHARSVANPFCNALSLLLKTNKADSCRDPVLRRSSVLGPSGLSVDPSESAALLCSTVHCSSTTARAARSIIICLAPVAPVYVAVQKGVDTALRRLPEQSRKGSGDTRVSPFSGQTMRATYMPPKQLQRAK